MYVHCILCEFLVSLYLEHISLGALGDSFYEYLLKSWLMTSKQDTEARDMYYESLSAIIKSLVKTTSKGLVYITDVKNGRPDNKMQHLVSQPLLPRNTYTEAMCIN